MSGKQTGNFRSIVPTLQRVARRSIVLVINAIFGEIKFPENSAKAAHQW
ncbi:hypothetical protein H6F67_19690 [Microcoleus sp. FACHB-1515]|nr:hypothetical protein [Microcoleus sp. FACHB-1515]MBD2092075.1 hypothetical protein [Microcoleus sp. FACHB-1515]